MNVGSHDYSIVGGNSEQGNKAYPHRHTQIDGVHLEKIPQIHSRQGKIQEPILSVQPEHDKSTGESHEYTREMYK